MVFQNTTSDSQGTMTWQWNFGDQAETSSLELNHTYEAPGTYLVKLNAFSETGCSSEFEKNVEVYPKPVANFNFDNACEGKSVNFENVSSISSGGLTFDWQFGGNNISIENNPTKISAART